MPPASVVAIEALPQLLQREARLLGLDVGTVIAASEVGALVIGLPINLDGSEGRRAQSTRAFARNLANHVDLPMVFWDERFSTAAVERHLVEADASRKRRAEVTDRMAAAYILQGALDRLKRLAEQR
jgi:putative Holliday junction resolvase